MLKLIVLCDLHLVPEGQVCNGLDTAERLGLAVRSINADHPDADLCVIAGDLAERGEVAAYRRMQAILADLAVPHLITLGNHDDRENFAQVYATVAGDAGVMSATDLKGYRVIVLDSQQPARHDGELGPARLDWLRFRLSEATDRPVIVVLHHHANDLFIPVDEIKLADADAFVTALQTHPDVRQVIAGHVHLTSTGLWRGIPFTTLGGSHYNVSAHLASMPGEQAHLEGPAQYAVVVGTADATVVHFHNYIDRHLILAPALFS